LASSTAYYLFIDRDEFVNIDVRYPVLVSVIDQTEPKVFKDTAFAFIMPDQVDVDLQFYPTLEQRSDQKIVTFYARPQDFHNNYIDPDGNEIAIKAFGAISGSGYTLFYDDGALTTPATDSPTFSGYKLIADNANGATDYVTFLKVPASPVIDEDVFIEIKWKSFGLTKSRKYILNVHHGVSLNAVGVADVDTAITDNTLINDIESDVTDILADTNEIQGKLPTGNMMGSSDKADYDGTLTTTLGNTAQLLSNLSTVHDNVLANGVAIGNLQDISIADIKAMTIDTVSFEDIMTQIFARTRGTFVVNQETGNVLYKTKGGLGTAYEVNYDDTGRQEVP
jgi:hypothetical protein